MDQNQQQDFSYLYSQQTPLNGGRDQNRMKRIVIGGSALFFFILIVIGIVIMLLQGPDYRSQLVKIAAEQSELIRVSDLALSERTATKESTIVAANVSSIANASVYQLTTYINENYELPVESASLRSQANSTIDTELEAAASRNQFDDRFNEIMGQLLSGYNNNIRELGLTLSEAGQDEIVQILSNIYDNNLLLAESI